jgi:hypothetical protein
MTAYLVYGIVGLIWLIGAALTYSRAENDGRNGSLWGLFSLLGGPIAWIAYAATADREAFGGGPIMDTAETASAHALHMGYTREAQKADPDIAQKASSDYKDTYVERMIAKGDLRGAKEAIHGMIQTAKETHDLAMLATYEKYGQQIRHKELESVDRHAPQPEAGPPMAFVDNTDMLHHNAKADVFGGEPEAHGAVV